MSTIKNRILNASWHEVSSRIYGRSRHDGTGVRLDMALPAHIITPMEQRSGGMAIVTLIISMIMVALLVVVALMIFTRRTAAGEDPVTAPVEKGKAVQCLAQRRRVETSLQQYQVEHGTFPATLDALAGFPHEEFRCPVTGTPYVYDPGVGKLICPDHP